MYFEPPSSVCPLTPPSPKLKKYEGKNPNEKPIVLVWFWPENVKFDFQDCKTLFNIDSCHLTDDRDLYSRAREVLIFHRAINDNLSNLPSSPRTKFQRWIWFNMDSPTNTRKIKGIEGLFNLTLSYRKDADIHVHWKLGTRKKADRDFVLPKKERSVCWIVEGSELLNKSDDKYNYYRELVKHIKVDIFDSSSDELLKGENYFQTISSCKFYLSFEDSIHKDYITEKFNGPLGVGTVPIVLGPPRMNYEDFAPGNSFIHVNDFPDAATLAEFLQKLDGDNEAYMRYFDWRQFFTPRRHLTEQHKFAHAICQACHHVAIHREYRAVTDVYKWFFV
ncbi:4-galactosyl-N-acetylglucosaminide 3-alpha-L-fucosyltransferase 9-like [Pagrus major]|uniref:4-galactosyl-N-acetylglucosaminide 3-alpha-L-fucosyltransferase 9-like n=1 Tax=Pagrus major TaxID=143350 RepID=UPI003CC89EE3